MHYRTEKPLTLYLLTNMICILLTLSAKASCGVSFTQTGLCDLLLKTGGNLDEREREKTFELNF